MSTKAGPGKYDCYARAQDDEPMFILLARDPSAPDIVEKWIKARMRLIMDGVKPMEDVAMLKEATECAQAMRIWWREYTDRPLSIIPPLRFRVPSGYKPVAAAESAELHRARAVPPFRELYVGRYIYTDGDGDLVGREITKLYVGRDDVAGQGGSHGKGVVYYEKGEQVRCSRQQFLDWMDEHGAKHMPSPISASVDEEGEND